MSPILWGQHWCPLPQAIFVLPASLQLKQTSSVFWKHTHSLPSSHCMALTVAWFAISIFFYSSVCWAPWQQRPNFISSVPGTEAGPCPCKASLWWLLCIDALRNPYEKSQTTVKKLELQTFLLQDGGHNCKRVNEWMNELVHTYPPGLRRTEDAREVFTRVLT
jgi:hypothetical protein